MGWLGRWGQGWLNWWRALGLGRGRGRAVGAVAPPRRLDMAQLTDHQRATEVVFALVATQRDLDRQMRALRARTHLEAARVADCRGARWCVGTESRWSASAPEWVWYEVGSRLQYAGGYRRGEWGEYTLVYDGPHDATVYVFATRDYCPDLVPRETARTR